MFSVLDNEFKIDGTFMKKIFVLLLCFFVAACVSNEPKMAGFQRQDILGDEITLAAWTKNIKPLKKLRIYIDGNAKSVGLFGKKSRQLKRRLPAFMRKKIPIRTLCIWPVLAFL